MIIGDRRIFAVESIVTEAYESKGLRALGCFVIHVGGNRYGVYESNAALLGNSLDDVERRIAQRGLHSAPFAQEPEPGRIADAFRDAIYGDAPKHEYFGVPRDQFCDLIYSGDLLWAPDGHDEAFDDGSYIIQFDIGDHVRLIAFKCGEDWLHDPQTLRDVSISADDYYQILRQWRDASEIELAALPKREI